jgi:transposase-like protein
LKGGTALEKRSQRRFSPDEKYRILQEGEYGTMSINEVCRRHGISTVTYYHWRNQAQGAMKDGLTDKRKNKKSHKEQDLEDEIKRLKNTIVEITQENVELKKKNFR